MDSVRQWLDATYGRGDVTFTLREACRSREASLVSTKSALSRAQRDSLLFSPARGFYVIVPSEYRAEGAPPWRWFLDPMLQNLGVAYYAGLLTAAAHHGASPQGAQEIQVVVDRPVRARMAGRQRLVFIQRRRAALAPVVEAMTPTGSVRVSTPAMTMLDLVAYPAHAAGWGNIASILPDLAPLVNRKGWADALLVKPRATDVQRLGHLLDRAGIGRTDVLAAWLAKRPIEPTLLVPGGGSAGDYDARWRVIVNAEVAAD